MESFVSFDGTRIAYERWGPADGHGPVILLHGFAVHTRLNWEVTGVMEHLAAAGHQVIGVDARGHGESDKPHDPSRYGEDVMAVDVSSLLDELDLAVVDLVGYSMGAIVSLLVAIRDARIRSMVVGGVGASVVELGGIDTAAVPREDVAAVLLADDPDTIAGSAAAGFRSLADLVDADRVALAAAATAAREGLLPLGAITAPTLVLAGTEDTMARRPEVLAAAIPAATLALVPGDHLTAVSNGAFAQALIGFLGKNG
ncbi:MAG TPA: alpha/beta hydrolase [Acidimicrobiales bacterium]|nr:alpha/beta hydrolase [Acidimicrobiales bacterium]